METKKSTPQAPQKTLSILLCSTNGNEIKMSSVKYILAKQIKQNGLKQHVEILECKIQAGDYTTSWQRNLLLKHCAGKYAMFIDTDGIVTADAIVTLVNKLDIFNPDVVQLTGTYTVNGMNPKTMDYSIKHKEFMEIKDVMMRPPTHLNAIATKHTKKFFFKELPNQQEADKDWAMQLSQSGLLKEEVDYTSPYYLQQFLTVKA